MNPMLWADRKPQLSSFFVLRTPLLPFDELKAWTDTGANENHTHHSWLAAIQSLRAGLKIVIEQPEVRQALFLASPSLEKSIDYWMEDPDSKKGLQAERSIVRYFSRMCVRCTPFGVFAGSSSGELLPATNMDDGFEINIGARNRYYTSSRLDFAYGHDIVHRLINDTTLLQAHRYHRNPNLHKIGELWHYVESRKRGDKIVYHLVKVASDPLLDEIIAVASHSLQLCQLEERILERFAEQISDHSQLRSYLTELIDNQILINDLDLYLTGWTPLDGIISQLTTYPDADDVLSKLRNAQGKLKSLDISGLGHSPTSYTEISKELEHFADAKESTSVFQVDLHKPLTSVRFSGILLEEITSAIDLLCAYGELSEPAALQVFRKNFLDRYERSWVPLLEVMDDEIGIGFDRKHSNNTIALLRDLPATQASPLSPGSFSERETRLLNILMNNWPPSDREVLLTPADATAIRRQRAKLPDSFNISCTLIARSPESALRGDYQIQLRTGYGPSGATLFGRFLQADPFLEDQVKELLNKEEAQIPDALFAEIIYKPEGNIGNILCRPILRDHEIICQGKSGTSPDRQIPLSDILVTLDTRNNIVLRSKTRGKRIIPRLTSAHAYHSQELSPIYRFLCMLQKQGGVGVPVFHWGGLEALEFLPRVRIGKVILSPARWRLSLSEIHKLRDKDRYSTFAEVKTLRKKRGLPRWVLLAEADNLLPVDLDNPLSVDAFAHVLKRAQKDAIVQELCPDPSDLCISGPEGCFYHELLIPVSMEPKDLTNKQPLESPYENPLPSTSFEEKSRIVPPGGEWHYIKIYGGPDALNDFLLTSIAELLTTRTTHNTPLKWFFVRYADPGEHLRLRFQEPHSTLSSNLVQSILEQIRPLLMSHNLHRVSIETYFRELERYGGPEGVAVSEDIFSADSAAVVRVLSLDAVTSGELSDWKLGVLGVHLLLDDFDLPDSVKLDLVKALVQGAYTEREITKEQSKSLNIRLRNERAEITHLLDDALPAPSDVHMVRLIFEERSYSLRPMIRALYGLEERGKLKCAVLTMIPSYIHMHLNRLIKERVKDYELIIYLMLSKYYATRIAMKSTPSSDTVISEAKYD